MSFSFTVVLIFSAVNYFIYLLFYRDHYWH